MLYTATFLASLATFSTAQTLNIPTRSGSIVSLAQPSTISGSVDYGNKEFDRGRNCDTDADTGSDSAVFILNDGATVTEDELRGWAKEQMANYKYPRVIEFAPTLPMTATGKVLKRELS